MSYDFKITIKWIVIIAIIGFAAFHLLDWIWQVSDVVNSNQ